MRGRRDITGRHLAMGHPLLATTVRLAMARDVIVIPGRQILLTPLRHVAQLSWPRSVMLRLLFQFTSSRFVLDRVTPGRRVTGLTLRADIIGCLELGCCRPLSASSGLPATGGLRESGTFGMPDIGGRTSATMAVSITAWVISDPATKAATGKAARSSTIPPLRG